MVLFADHKSRLCHIKWFSREGKELFEERGVSVYDIMEHSDFVFSAGDVVVRVVRSDSEYMETAAEGEAVERPTPCVGQVSLLMSSTTSFPGLLLCLYHGKKRGSGNEIVPFSCSVHVKPNIVL